MNPNYALSVKKEVDTTTNLVARPEYNLHNLSNTTTTKRPKISTSTHALPNSTKCSSKISPKSFSQFHGLIAFATTLKNIEMKQTFKHVTNQTTVYQSSTTHLPNMRLTFSGCTWMPLAKPSKSCSHHNPTCKAEPYIGCPCPWILGGHGCDVIVHEWAWVQYYW